MAERPRRRRLSRELPPDLSELKDDEHNIRKVAELLYKISHALEGLKEQTDEIRTTTVLRSVRRTALGLGLGVLILAATVTEGVSFLAAAGAAVAMGTAAVVGAGIMKTMKERGKGAEEVENLGKEFQEIVEPLQNELEEIKRTCEQLEEETAKLQAEKTLSDMEEFQRILRRVAELRRKERTAEEDRKFRESITKSADQSQRIIDAFEQMKKELSQFPGNETFRRFLNRFK